MIVTEFNEWKSFTNLKLPSFFYTNKTDAPHGALDGQMSPFSKSSIKCALSVSSSFGVSL